MLASGVFPEVTKLQIVNYSKIEFSENPTSLENP